MQIILICLLMEIFKFKADIKVDYNFIDKSDILNIHNYLMTKNNIK